MSELIEQGGAMLWLQGLFLFLALVFILERLLFFQGEGARSTDLLLGVGKHLKKGLPEEALHEAERAPGASARVVRAVLARDRLPRADLSLIAHEAAILEIPAIEKNLRGLQALSLLAPLAGLLGTVLGMMDVFTGADPDGASVNLAMSGLFKCLITTATGLGVSLLAYLCYLWILGKAKRLLHELERVGIEAVNMVCDQRP